MNKEALIGRLLIATPEQMNAVEAVFNGRVETKQERTSTRMLDYRQAADALNVSRQTIRRMIAAGRLPTVEIRAGRTRVPEAAIIALVASATRKGKV
jgi:excisionase family DNA binding protein